MSHFRPIITPYNPSSNWHLAETLICDQYKNCDTYYMPIYKNLPNKLTTLAVPQTIPQTLPQTTLRPSKFTLVYPLVYGDYFNFGGSSDNNFKNNTLLLSVVRPGKYLIQVSFPWYQTVDPSSQNGLPTEQNLETTYAYLYVNGTKYRLDEWSWVTNGQNGTMSTIATTPVGSIFTFKTNDSIQLSNNAIPIPQPGSGDSYITLIPVPQNALPIQPQQTAASTTMYAPWTVAQEDANNNACVDPTNFLKSYPINNFIFTNTPYTPPTFIYSPMVTSNSNNSPVSGVKCQQAGTYGIQIATNKPAPFSYTGYLVYSLSGVTGNQQWTVPQGQSVGQDPISKKGYFQLTMAIGDYIYLTGYCTHTKITGTLNLTNIS